MDIRHDCLPTWRLLTKTTANLTNMEIISVKIRKNLGMPMFTNNNHYIF